MRLCLSSTPWSDNTALRRAFGPGLGIVLMVLQLFAPQAGHAAGGDWIEICGQHGAVLIEVNSDGIPLDSIPANETECPECPTCALCALRALTAAVAIETTSVAAGLEPSLLMSRWYASDINIPSPAQFWHMNRGPPLVETATRHRGLRALALIPMKGEVPCS